MLNQPWTEGKPAESTVRSRAANPKTMSVSKLGSVALLFAFLHTLKINLF